MEAFGKVADELYALPPREFTAARDAAVATARKDGDRPLAAKIRSLRRPTLAAFALNRLVRAHREEVGPLLELGHALREAQQQLAGPRLRELSAQRRQLVAALAEQARRAAAETGERLGAAQLREVEQSLRAALADERAAGELAEGRLTGVLEEPGVLDESGLPVQSEVPEQSGAVSAARSGTGGRSGRAGPAASAERGSGAAEPADESEEAERWASARREALKRVAEAETALAEAEAAQRAAGREAERLDGQVARLAAETAAAAGRAERAREALERAERKAAQARDAEQARRTEHRAAAERAADAERATGRARDELDAARIRLRKLESEKGGR